MHPWGFRVPFSRIVVPKEATVLGSFKHLLRSSSADQNVTLSYRVSFEGYSWTHAVWTHGPPI